MQVLFEQIKPVMALRMARACLGWSQEELASQVGIAKTTLARFETLEGGLTVEQLTRLLRLYHQMGVAIEFITTDDVTIKANPVALRHASERLQDVTLRRADRRKPKGLLGVIEDDLPPDDET